VSSAEEVMGPLWPTTGPARVPVARTPTGTRTRTVPILSRPPLPIGLWGRGGAPASAERLPAGHPMLERIMTAVIRSLADSLRRFGDERLEALLVARPDLASPLPRGIGPLACRAAAATTARRALVALRLPELELVQSLAVLDHGSSSSQLASAVSSDAATFASALERLITLS